MKGTFPKVIGVLVALVMMLAYVAIAPTPAQAVGTITATFINAAGVDTAIPAGGNPKLLSDLVTVTGTGFTTGENVTFAYSTGTIQYAPWTSGTPVGVWTNSTGGFTVQMIFLTSTGAGNLVATGDQSLASAAIVVTPGAAGAPTYTGAVLRTGYGASAADDKLGVAVQGFGASRQLDVSFAGVSVAATDMEPAGIPTTNIYGAYTTTIRIPLCDKGTNANQVRISETVGTTPTSLATG